MPGVRCKDNRLRPILANGTGAVVYARTAAGVDGGRGPRRPRAAARVRRHRRHQGGVTLAFDLLGADVEWDLRLGRDAARSTWRSSAVRSTSTTRGRRRTGPAVDPLVQDGTAVRSSPWARSTRTVRGFATRGPRAVPRPSWRPTRSCTASSPTPTGSRRTGDPGAPPTRTRRRCGCPRRRPTRRSTCSARPRRRMGADPAFQQSAAWCSAATGSTPPPTSTSAWRGLPGGRQRPRQRAGGPSTSYDITID